MKSEIVSFCNKIKNKYCLFLFHNNFGENGEVQYCTFPYCCKLSADIITSYFKLCFGDKFKYIYTTNSNVYNHAWTLYEDDNEKFIIDFTDFQHGIDNEVREKFIKHKISDEEILNEISKREVVIDVEETYYYGLDSIMCPKEQQCCGVKNNTVKNINLSEEKFSEFLKKVSPKIFSETSYN